jgi:hypothetical protein
MGRHGMRFAAMSSMRDTKSEPTKRIVRLVEAIHHGARLIAPAAVEDEPDDALRQFTEKIHERVEQFEFELRTELTRLAAEPVVISNIPQMNMRLAFEMMLESYRDTLASSITPHARAMITRQFHELQKAYDELMGLHLAA